jgi:uncharacterized alpha-E superfamily protein
VYSDLFLDLPQGTGMGWRAVLNINGVDNAYAASGGDPDDAAAMVRFMLIDEANAASLLSAVGQARENARVVRDVIPTEAWRVLNETHLAAQSKLPRAINERRRREILDDMVRRCQLFAGLIAGTMSHGDGYQFVRMGWHLERADMTTRIIDVAAALLMTDREDLVRFDNTLWMAVLRSLSAYQMYRQHVRRRVAGPDVIAYLLSDPLFPRSVAHCLERVGNAIRLLPCSEAPAQCCAAIRARRAGFEPDSLDPAALHAFIDELQVAFAGLDEEFVVTWFAPDAAA